jgi:NAD(P)-dependent dehydrogenase (short-subunit alcohol dehydrogenase family)
MPPGDARPGPLSGLRTLVVEGSGSLGRAIAGLLAADGAAVTFTGRSEERLAAAHRALAAEGLEVWALACEPTVSTDLAHAVAIAAGGGRLDIAVIVLDADAPVGPVTELDEGEVVAAVDRTLRPFLLMVKHAGRAMEGGGSIVAVWPVPPRATGGRAAADAVAAAVGAVVRASADELGRLGIRVAVVGPEPGWTGARGTGATQPDDLAWAVRQRVGPGQPPVSGG